MRVPHFFAMLLKRLFKRPVFLALLALIPALTLLYSAASQESAGMVTVALAQDDREDALAARIIAALPENSRIILFLPCESREDAARLVAAGKADCAWVFHPNTEENIRAFLRSRSQKDALVTVYQRQGNALLLLARERLNAQLYTCIAQELYLARLTQESAALAALSQEELMAFWENTQIPGELFAFSQSQGQPPTDNYLLSPLRGLLAVTVLLGALANALFVTRDEEAGTFAFLPHRLGWLPEFAGGLCSGVTLCAGVFVSLALAGIPECPLREAACLLGLALSCTTFSMTVRRLAPRVSTMAALLPVLICVTLVACPVFFPIRSLRWLSALLPVGLYLNAATGAASPLWLVAHSLACFLIARLPRRHESGPKAF